MSLDENLQAMVEGPGRGAGMDVVIVSTTGADQEAFWQERLTLGLGQVCKRDAVVLVVHEDWEGGAGNGLGTLYALRKATAKGKELFSIDLLGQLERGAAVALYHTAGKGTRLAPLPGSESNNKPAVKLPGLLELGGERVALTILEAVIRQTAIYAPSRRGRLSVFWGDQIFIPSASAACRATHHADILARLGPMPDAAAWEEKGLHKYGLIAVGADGDAAQVEKISHETASALIADGVIQVGGGIGVSLGSFSISAALALALVQEFSAELDAKKGKLDSDPHFWMPLTLDEQTYLEIMAQKDVTKDEARAHFARMQGFLERFRKANPGARIFGCVDTGPDCYWWDYGQLPFYVANNLKMTGCSAESAAMRTFFGISDSRLYSKLGPELDADDASLLLNCNIGAGKIRNSVLIGVTAEQLEVEDAVLINVAAPEIRGRNILLYNVAEPGSLTLELGTVRADAYFPGQKPLAMWTALDRDGGCDWYETLPGNKLSYDGLHKVNQAVPPAQAMALTKAAIEQITAQYMSM